MHGMNVIRRKSGAGLLVATLIGLAAPAAAEVQTHASIRDAARIHALDVTKTLAGTPRVTVRELDSRLKLTACDQPLETYDSPNGLNGGRGVVGVRCNGSKPWKLYVPVRVAVIERVVVSRRPVVRGQSLQREDLALDEVDTSGLHKAYFTRIEDVVGLRSKRAISAGSTLHAGLLRREQLVKRGAQVQIIANTGGLYVTMRGKALADGGHGDRIRVKNLNSGRVVSGTVSGRGVIQVEDAL
ncbi:MAG: flagellar basal body P-ring formation protein FlgA [Gammaproteobacteria bacterium]|nr:flagellar basal body P-ring formation protein FlgA [Gammaproteobacteria bacterium]